MEYGKLILGIVLIITFSWFLKKNVNRYGLAKATTSVDIILGLIAGIILNLYFNLVARDRTMV